MNDSNTSQFGSICMEQRTFLTVQLVISLVLGIGSLVGNLLVILLAVRYVKRRNLNYLIINMAVSDILVVVVFALGDFSLPSGTSENIANFVCKLSSLKVVPELITLLTLLWISMERYKATKVFNQRNWSHVKLIFITWTLSMMLSLFRFVLSYASRSSVDLTYRCSINKSTVFFKIFFLFKTFCILILYFVVFALSIVTARKLSKPLTIQAHLSVEQRIRRAKRLVGAIRMVLCSVMLYTICYLPEFLEDLLEGLTEDSLLHLSKDCEHLMDFIFGALKGLNSCLSPLVYFIFLSDFRSALNRIVSKNVQPTVSSTSDNTDKHYDDQTQDTRF